MEIFVLKEEKHMVELISVSIRPGELSVVQSGMMQLLQLHVDSLAIRCMVRSCLLKFIATL